jgi:hypothetical protein
MATLASKKFTSIAEDALAGQARGRKNPLDGEPADPLDRLHTIKGTTRRLGGISTVTLYDLVRKKKLTITKVGDRSFISEREILRFLTRENSRRK